MSAPMFPDATPCSECWFYLVCNWEPRGPVPEAVQEAMGGDVDALHRFFDSSDVVADWTLPLFMTWARASEWRETASWWRAARLKREGGFLSLAEIKVASFRGTVREEPREEPAPPPAKPDRMVGHYAAVVGAGVLLVLGTRWVLAAEETTPWLGAHVAALLFLAVTVVLDGWAIWAGRRKGSSDV